MKWHMLAFEKASAGGVTLEDVTGIQDDIFALNASSHYLIPQDMSILFAYALNPNLTVAQISSPHLRTICLPAIEPLDVGTAPTSIPSIDWNPPPYTGLRQNDDLSMLQTDTAGGAIQKTGLMGLAADLSVTVPPGEIYTMRGTVANTSASRTWQTISLSFDQTFPGGTYSVIGMDAIGAHLVAARILFPGGGFRPGCIARTSEANKPDRRFRKGFLGEWGRFTTIAPPSVQLLGDGTALTTQTVALDVVKVG